jgi:hypothetical protein
MVNKQDVKDLITEAKAMGFEVTRSTGSSKHLKFSLPDPNGLTVFGSSSPSDWRSVANIRGKLRRAKAVWLEARAPEGTGSTPAP